MPDVIDRTQVVTPRLPAPRIPLAPPDERPARQTLLRQIARLEAELGEAFCSAFPRTGLDWSVPSRGGGPRLLGLAELEELRDDLVGRIHRVRGALDERAAAEEESRRRIEAMMLDPERYKFERVSNEDLGEPGCKHWHVLPQWGLLGMLLGWWRVRISSGCPLAGGRGAAATTPHPASRRGPSPPMGRRSRKRMAAGEPAGSSPGSRAERDAARRERVEVAAATGTPRPRRRGGRPGMDERPPPPWGRFPLVELVTLLAIVLGVAGAIVWGRQGQLMLLMALVLGSLAGLELSIREHVTGFRSHSSLLAGIGAVVTMTAVFIAAGRGATGYWAGLAAGGAVFAAGFWALRELFKRRSGGLGFR